jgi:diguanylate cyclase (GGDEF)-like protein
MIEDHSRQQRAGARGDRPSGLHNLLSQALAGALLRQAISGSPAVKDRPPRCEQNREQAADAAGTGPAAAPEATLGALFTGREVVKMDASSAWRALRESLPQGGSLPNEVWERRHRRIVALLWLHVLGIPFYGFVLGVPPAHVVMEASIVAVTAIAATRSNLGRKTRSVAATLGLFSSSAILVHLSGGLIEMHFHFFVMVAVVTLYQDWVPFLLAIGYVIVHHGLMGWLFPRDVYNHPAAISDPWTWAFIHGTFIAAESIALLVAWRLGEEGFEDPLTKLSNRTLFADRVHHALANAYRHRHSISVAFLDLDGFKTVNDSLGHHTGDKLLIAVAQRIRSCLRDVDTAARLGGDEFALLLENSDERGAVMVAERVQAALREPFEIDNHELNVSASIGISTGNRGTEDSGELLRNADAAMYVAKSKGKARYECFSPGMHIDAITRLQNEADLRRAIRNEEFTLQYQPIVDLATGRISAVEALARWEHPQRGLVPPRDFIPVAEEIRLVTDIGRYILREACQQVRLWQEEFPSDPALKVSVNLSAKQLEDPNLTDDIVTALQEADLPPDMLTLEITETILMQDTDFTATKLRELKALGVQLAIDDFGTGYSSLSYLRRFPIDILKIDRSFISAMEDSIEAAALPRAIVALGRTLKLQTVAEGIETPEQLSELRAMLCHQAQGYLFAKPLWCDGIEAILAKPQMDIEARHHEELQAWPRAPESVGNA